MGGGGFEMVIFDWLFKALGNWIGHWFGDRSLSPN